MQYSVGSQNIRTIAMVQLLLGMSISGAKRVYAKRRAG
jgi:anaerobic selenocysteine-containing dehydrogenase